MPEYRLYFMDRFSGHIDQAREFEADDDQAAVSIAEGWRLNGPMELWSRDQKVKRWQAYHLAACLMRRRFAAAWLLCDPDRQP